LMQRPPPPPPTQARAALTSSIRLKQAQHSLQRNTELNSPVFQVHCRFDHIENLSLQDIYFLKPYIILKNFKKTCKLIRQKLVS
jgi:hypothetical protein